MKTPVIRLMDMLAGWADFCGAESKKSYYENEMPIGNLYQLAGQKSLVGMKEEEIRAFLIDKVLPLIMTGKES